MQIKNTFFILLMLITSNHSVKAMEESMVVFQKNLINPGCIQDLNALFTLEKMARTAFNNLQENNQSISDEPLQSLKLAKQQASKDSVAVPQKTLTGLVDLVIKDGGKIKLWPMARLMGGYMNTQLLDKNGKNSMHIEGPILDAARAGSLFQEDTQELKEDVEASREVLQQLGLTPLQISSRNQDKNNGQCIIN